MRKFIPLDKQALPAAFDAEIQGGAPLVEVTESERRIDITYRFPGYFSSERELDVKGHKHLFEALEIAGVGQLMESGKPLLPSFGRYLQIPAGCTYTLSVRTPGTPMRFEHVTVAPAQARLTDGPTKHKVEYDEAAYASTEPYPKQPVTVTGPVQVDGYNALLLHVCPFQYLAKPRELLAYPRIEVTLEFAPCDGADSPQGLGDTQGREAFGNLFLNPRRGISDRLDLPPVPIRLPNGPELLIVHATQFTEAAKRLARWKNQRGLMTELLEFAADVSTPAKAATAYAALKAELRTRRAKVGARLRYVLLLGDTDDIPNEERGGNTTDYYCSTQKDYAAGQPMPMPWLALGRIPVRNATEALSVVDQIVAYERTPPTDLSYFHRFVCAAHFETSLVTNPDGSKKAVDGRDYVFTIETICKFLRGQGWDAERVYTCDRTITPSLPLYYQNGTPVPADVVASLMTSVAATKRLVDATTEGHLIFGHRDHGGMDGWVHPPFTLTDLDKVAGTTPSMFYSVNCVTGSFQSSTTAESFGEKILRLPGTAPTLVAATENSSTWHNNAMILGLYDAMFGGLLPTFPATTLSYPVRFNRFGDIFNYARAYLATAHAGDMAGVLANHEMYHVLGDPSIEVWGGEPKPLRVRAIAQPPGAQPPSSVLIELSTAAPDCVVTLWVGGTLMKRLTPTGTRVTVPLTGLPVVPMPLLRVLTVCAWAPGFHYAEAKLSLPFHLLTPVD